MLRHTMRKRRPAVTTEAKEVRGNSQCCCHHLKHQFYVPPGWQRAVFVRSHNMREYTETEAYATQMGNHNSNCLTKHLNSFLPAMQLILMTKTMLG